MGCNSMNWFFFKIVSSAKTFRANRPVCLYTNFKLVIFASGCCLEAIFHSIFAQVKGKQREPRGRAA